jgi:hypothetical protein
MVNYSAGFKLPFTNWKIFWLVFLLGALSGITNLVGSDKPSTFSSFEIISSPEGKIAAYVVSILAALIITGYTLKILKSATEGRNELLAFGNLLSLMWAGLKVSIAAVIYCLPVILPIIMIGMAAYSGLESITSAGLILFAFLILIVWVLFLAYILPIATARFAHENRFGAFFELSSILNLAFKTAYFVPWIAIIAYLLGVYLVVVLIMLIFVGISSIFSNILAAAFLLIFSGLIEPLTMPVNNIIGQAYREVAVEKNEVSVQSKTPTYSRAKPKKAVIAVKRKPAKKR